MILVDTSIWVNHLRATDERLAALLERREVLGHPFVAGEVALGHLSRRAIVLSELRNLPQAAVATAEEVLDLIEAKRLYGRGIGYIDVHLLAAVRIMPKARLWTADRRLQEVAAEFGVAAMLAH